MNVLALSTCSRIVTVLDNNFRLIAKNVKFPTINKLERVVATGAFCSCVT